MDNKPDTESSETPVALGPRQGHMANDIGLRIYATIKALGRTPATTRTS